MKLKMTNLLLSCVVLASCNDHNSPVPASGPFQVAESKALPEVKQPEIEEQMCLVRECL